MSGEFVYEYRLAGERQMRYIQAHADDEAVRGMLEALHQRQVDCLLTNRTATPQDTVIPSADPASVAAAWDRAIARVTARRNEPAAPLAPAAYSPAPIDNQSKHIAASWDRVIDKLGGKVCG